MQEEIFYKYHPPIFIELFLETSVINLFGPAPLVSILEVSSFSLYLSSRSFRSRNDDEAPVSKIKTPLTLLIFDINVK